MKKCRKCDTEWKGVTQPGTRETCRKCGADLHSCVNCGLYDQNSSQQCKESLAEFVLNKDRYNFCEYFKLNEKDAGNDAKTAPPKAKDAFDKLFKK